MPDQLWALILFAVVATGSPGGATALATASGARFGYLPSLPLILGIACALAGLVAVSATGLASTLQGAPFLATMVKAIGSAYLLWLALKTGLAGPPSKAGMGRLKPMSFSAAAALLLVNPKALAMAIGVASSFSDMVSQPLLLGVILASIFALSACVSLSLWVLAGGVIAKALRTNRHWHLFNGSMAVLLVSSISKLWICALQRPRF